MTEEQRTNDLIDMFLTPGWQHFIEEFSDVAASLDTLGGISSTKSLYRAKGKLDVLSLLLTYEDVVRLDETDI